jgi:glycerophosphoryl diester phosphodiesterase
MFAEYRSAGVSPNQVFAQSFSLDDIVLWNRTAPDFAAQAVFLDGRYESPGFDPARAETWRPSMAELKATGVKILAPPIYALVALDAGGAIVASEYAKAAKAEGLDLIAWSLERDGPLDKGGGFFHRSVRKAIDRDGDTMTVLDVLAQQVGVRGVFSDWPATTTFYASCMGLK